MQAAEETPADGPRPRTMLEVKIAAVLEAINRNGGNKVKAAADLDVTLKTIYNLLVAGGIHDRKVADGRTVRTTGVRSPEWAEGVFDRFAQYAGDGLLSEHSDGRG